MKVQDVLIPAVLILLLGAGFILGQTFSIGGGSQDVKETKEGIWGDSKYADLHIKTVDTLDSNALVNGSYALYVGGSSSAASTGYTDATEKTISTVVGKDEGYRILFGGTSAYYVEKTGKADSPVIRLEAPETLYANPNVVELENRGTYKDLLAGENLTVTMAAGESKDVVLRLKAPAKKQFGQGKFAVCMDVSNDTVLEYFKVLEGSEMSAIPKTLKSNEYCYEVSKDLKDNGEIELTLEPKAKSDADPSNLVVSLTIQDFGNYIDEDDGDALKDGYVDEDGNDVGASGPTVTGKLILN